VDGAWLAAVGRNPDVVDEPGLPASHASWIPDARGPILQPAGIRGVERFRPGGLGDDAVRELRVLRAVHVGPGRRHRPGRPGADVRPGELVADATGREATTALLHAAVRPGGA